MAQATTRSILRARINQFARELARYSISKQNTRLWSSWQKSVISCCPDLREFTGSREVRR